MTSEISAVEIGNFQLAARGRPYLCGLLWHTRWVEVEASHSVVRLRLFWLLLDGHCVIVRVELHHAEALGIVHPIPEYGGSPLLGSRRRCAQSLPETVSVEDVVPEHERAGLFAAEIRPDEERLREPVRTWLLGIG